jgi:subtilase family serine protease
MTLSFASLRAKAASLAGCVALLASFSPAQKPEVRILTPVSNSVRTTLTGTRPPMVQSAADAGRVPGTTAFQSVTISFSPTAAQKAALDALIEAQQNPASPQYHQWLTPEQFGAQFGAADADIAQVQSWLEQQGFTVNEVSRNRSQISFSGSVAQVEAAFGIEMHYYNVNGEKHLAPSTDVSIPASFAGAVSNVGNLSDFKPRAHFRPRKNFTAGNGEGFFMTPGDVSVIYDINPAYSAGYTGAGQSIVVIGQSNVVASDITTFQTLVGAPVRTPTGVGTPIPNTGTSAIVSGDEAESDLDLEYTSSIAKNATIYFAYTGNAANTGGAFYALEYVVANKTAPIVSSSYGNCEVYLGTANLSSLDFYMQEAATQGQTVISAAGDDGSTDCYGNTGVTVAQQVTPTVDYPASSQYVTGVGGTEFPAADVAAGSSYWTPETLGTDIIVTAKSYIPEMVWNDDEAYLGTSIALSLSSGGGGVSIYSPRPSWQTGVAGIPAGSFRLVPDVALDASNFNAPYLVCSSDSGSFGYVSCQNGFRDSSGRYYDAAGGTSFAAPIFAGMLAIINQKVGGLYQGVINKTLYSLASNSTTYASAFHDITSGNNECTLNTVYATSYNSNGTAATTGPACTSTAAASFAAATGYDQASGLGSIDLFNLLTAWPNAVQLTGSSTTVSAVTLTPASGAVDTITFKVASASTSVTTVPTGTINLSVDNTPVQSLTLVNGAATYAYTSTVLGAHVITGVYTGDTNFSTSTGTVTVTVATSTLKATTTSLSPAPTGTVTVTLDGATVGTLNLTAGSTTSTTTYTLPATTALGSHIVTAQYSGDSVYQASQTPLPSLTISVASPGSFTLSASGLAITDGSTSNEGVSVTPASGFSGAVNVSLSTTSNIVNACYTTGTGTVSGVTVIPVTIYTNASNCPSGALALVKTGARASNDAPAQPGRQLPVGVAMAGLLAMGFAGRRSRKLRGLIAVALLAAAGFGLSGCGSSDTTGAGISTSAAKGSYAVTVSATDVATGTKTATTTFTLTIQ